LNVHQYKDCIFKTWRCMAAYRWEGSAL
jgi:hypothetical protein